MRKHKSITEKYLLRRNNNSTYSVNGPLILHILYSIILGANLRRRNGPLILHTDRTSVILLAPAVSGLRQQDKGRQATCFDINEDKYNNGTNKACFICSVLLCFDMCIVLRYGDGIIKTCNCL